MNPVDPWWTQQQSGLLFGLLGAAVGLLGAVLGCCAFLIRQGRAKPLVYGFHALGVVVGLAGLALGLAALIAGQPFHVWFPPLNLALVGLLVFGGLYFFVTRPHYRAAEHRKLEAASLRTA